MQGDRAGAEDAFRAMAERADTRLLGLRGLYVEAQRRNDPVAARLAAEAAAQDAPALAWAGQAVLEFRCAAGDWDGALAVLEGNRRAACSIARTYRRQRAVLLTARALGAEDERPRRGAHARRRRRRSSRPTWCRRRRSRAGCSRKPASGARPARSSRPPGRPNPHPDLAETYAHVRLGGFGARPAGRVQALARAGARPRRGRARGRARGARCARVRDRARCARARSRPSRPSASPC